MIDTALSILDAPGGFVRNLLSGRNPFALDDEHRASGRDVLESWGLLGSNTPGLDFGDALGFGAEMLLDPLNALGGLGLFRAASAAKAARASNAVRSKLLLQGAMPEEVARATRFVDDAGNPQRFFHGTGSPVESFRDLSPEFAGQNIDSGWYGRGVYAAGGPEGGTLATEYANMGREFASNDFLFPEPTPRRVLTGFVDSRNPFVVDIGHKPYPEQFDALLPASARQEVQQAVQQARPRAPAATPGAPAGWGSAEPGLEQLLHKVRSDAVTRALQSQGYDSVAIMNAGNPFEVAVFDQSQLYNPWVAPALRRVPSTIPWLASLGAYNAINPFRATPSSAEPAL